MIRFGASWIRTLCDNTTCRLQQVTLPPGARYPEHDKLLAEYWLSATPDWTLKATKRVQAPLFNQHGNLVRVGLADSERKQFSATRSQSNCTDDNFVDSSPIKISAQAESHLLLLGCRQPLACRSDMHVVEGDAVGTKLLLCDDRVNIWEFKLAPQAQCNFHHHRLPYLFTNLTCSVTQALDEHGLDLGTPSRQEAGATTYVRDLAGASHGVRNVGEDDFVQFVVEFK